MPPAMDEETSRKANVTGLAGLKPRCSDSEDSAGPDSGYGSAVSTPKTDKSTAVSQVNSSDGVESSISRPKLPIPFQLPNPANLNQFEKDVDKATIDRFKDVLELVEGPLLGYMRKSRRRYLPIAIRLMVLGKSEDDAKPWIVVLCNEDRSRQVKRFFDKKLAKDLCRPQDSTLPSFDILVVGQPPQTKTSTVALDVYGGTSPQNGERSPATSCGTIIKLVTAEHTRFATLGGIIQVIAPSGDYELYGMTAGHMTEELNDFNDGDDESTWDEDSHEDISSDDESEVGTPENGDGFFDANDAPCRVISTLEVSPFPKPSPEVPDTWVKLGNTLVKTRDLKHRNECNHDWALVENLDRSYFRSNLLGGQERDSLCRHRELKEPLQSKASFQKAQSVIVISGSQGHKRGKLSSLPSMLLLAPGRKFVQTYPLALDDGSKICEGDSGSWVVNEATLEVYGHVVATDTFGEAYVVPLPAIFADIKEQLGAESVCLPTAVDIFCKKSEVVVERAVDSQPIAAPPTEEQEKKGLMPERPFPQETLARDSGYSSRMNSCLY